MIKLIPDGKLEPSHLGRADHPPDDVVADCGQHDADPSQQGPAGDPETSRAIHNRFPFLTRNFRMFHASAGVDAINQIEGIFAFSGKKFHLFPKLIFCENTPCPQVSGVSGPRQDREVPAVNVCLFLPNWLGDLVMAVPAIRAIREKLGHGAHVVGILRPNLAGLLSGSDWIDEFWYYDPRGDDRRFGTWALIHELRQVHWDLGILFTNSLRTALLATTGGIPERVGYARDGRSALLTQALPVPRDGKRVRVIPMVDYYLRLAEAIGATSLERRLELPLTLWGEVCADRVWRDLGLPQRGSVVAMHLGGAFGQAKCWPAEHFAELARRIVTATPAWVLFVCGARERETVREVARAVNHPRVVSLADQPLDLQTLKSCLNRCAVMVSTDSGPRHIAAALGRPVVTLYGPIPAVNAANPTVQGVDLELALECRPCWQRECPLGHHRCMRDLTPEIVFQATLPFLREQRLTRVA